MKARHFIGGFFCFISLRFLAKVPGAEIPEVQILFFFLTGALGLFLLLHRPKRRNEKGEWK